MKLTIRLDDITPDMDMERFARFRTLMERYGVKPLLGVVPSSQDPSLDCMGGSKEERLARKERFSEELLRMRDDGYRIAMHGLHHVYATDKGGLFPLNRKSEFAGRPLEEQRRMIREGKELLSAQGITTDLFMAPAHSFDRDTLCALKENGFTKLTDGFGRAPYLYEGMTFYPISFRRKRSVADTKEGMTTLVVHTNTLNEQDFTFYEDVFRTGRVVPYAAWEEEQTKNLPPLGHALHYLMATGKRVVLK